MEKFDFEGSGTKTDGYCNISIFIENCCNAKGVVSKNLALATNVDECECCCSQRTQSNASIRLVM